MAEQSQNELGIHLLTITVDENDDSPLQCLPENQIKNLAKVKAAAKELADAWEVFDAARIRLCEALTEK